MLTNFSKVEEFRKYIEVESLKLIQKLVEERKTEKERIQAIARQTLDLIKPGMSLEQLYQNAVKLDDQYLELTPLVFKIMKEHEEKYEKKALEQVSWLVKNKQYDQAEVIVKKVLAFKISP
jgi:hypothetical protein